MRPHRRVRQRVRRLLAGAVLAALAAAAGAQTVSMSGRLGDRALLMIDGSPRTLAVGSTVQGVKLLSVTADEAVVDLAGRRVAVRMGGAQVNLGGGGAGDEVGTIVLAAGPGGHFTGLGSINGRSVEFVVDTGATLVAMGQGDADRIGLKYRDGPRTMVGTANGAVPAHRVVLGSVRVGAATVYDVEALVMPAQMAHVLLGNSFLSRFQMRRENDVMTLVKR